MWTLIDRLLASLFLEGRDRVSEQWLRSLPPEEDSPSAAGRRPRSRGQAPRNVYWRGSFEG